MDKNYQNPQKGQQKKDRRAANFVPSMASSTWSSGVEEILVPREAIEDSFVNLDVLLLDQNSPLKKHGEYYLELY